MSAPTPFPTRCAGWLTRQRLTAQAAMLLACLWAVAAVDFSNAGVIDRAGNVKFQDFIQFYVGAALVHAGKIALLYDGHTALTIMHQIAPKLDFGLPMVYGPQVSAWFIPLSRFSYLTAAGIWVAVSVVIYLVCCYLVRKTCPALSREASLFWLFVLAHPSFFHFVIRGQISALILACFTAAYFAFRTHRPFLAGLALGSLVFKPQFLAAVPVLFLLARTWKPLIGMIASVAGQLALTWAWCGTEVMRRYV
ncbi:MAG TPA: glycosyltransferase family 87 protein, partial [Terriglobales bacterium]|nr:glycosyltransferase family 87 protein [Terriglobales bacterium]